MSKPSDVACASNGEEWVDEWVGYRVRDGGQTLLKVF